MSDYNCDQLEALLMVQHYLEGLPVSETERLRATVGPYLRFRSEVSEFQREFLSEICIQACFTTRQRACWNRDGIATFLADTVITTGIIKLEILAGAKTEKEYRRLKSRFDASESLETNEELWRNACEHGFKLRRRGLTVPSTHVLIASCALQAGAVLLHANAHFDLIEKPLGLRNESYVQVLKKALS